jgi:serine/threonine-protein kinase RsbW
MTDEQQYLLVLALDEVCANLIIHSHGCNNNDTIDIKISRAADGVCFEVKDSKPDSFNNNTVRPPLSVRLSVKKSATV